MDVVVENLPKVVKKSPYKVSLEEGKIYSFCTCGLSNLDPICDGAHKGTGFKSIKFTPDASKEYYLCGCKHSKNMPFCDGSHNLLND
jgi:CDGSH-type Zn-finger protein